jgi:hypothetical protein
MFLRKKFLPSIFTLLAILILTQAQQASAEDGVKKVSYDQMATTAMRGTYMFSSGNADDAAMLFTPTFVRHEQQFLTPESKLEDISKLIESQRKTYNVEDIQTEPLNTIVDVKGNTVAVRWSAEVKRSTAADSELPENMKFTGVTISRFENDKIAEQWVYYDTNLVLTLIRLNKAQ